MVLVLFKSNHFISLIPVVPASGPEISTMSFQSQAEIPAIFVILNLGKMAMDKHRTYKGSCARAKNKNAIQ